MTTMLLEWFATAVFLILAVMLLRAVFGKRVSAGMRYALWGAVLLRLLIPVQLFTSPLAGTRVFFNSSTEQNIYKVTDDGLEKGGPEDILALGGQDGPAVSVQSPSAIVPPAVPNLPDVPQAPDAPEAPGPDWPGWAWLGAAWLAGSAVTALVFLSCNLRFWRQLRRTRRPLDTEQAHDALAYTTLPVYVAEGLPSPCLFGLTRPAIYVTPEAAADPAALRHVLAHEHTHFRHGDHIWNLLRCAALCVHWWNPLVWLSAVLSRRDGELACDEGALKRLGDSERAAYGTTLLALVTAPADPGSLLRCATTMAGDKKSLIERVSRIARAPKKWLWAAVVAALCLSLACVCAFGQKAEPANRPDIPAELTFSMVSGMVSDNETRAYVRMNGTVDGMELPRGAAWDPNSTWGKSPSGELSLVYPGFEGLGQHVNAWWTDEDRTSVTMSTYMGATCSSIWNVGYWEFTVDLDSGIVTAMEGLSRDGSPDEETVFYPESISDEEAIRAARVAAKLMEEAEAFYNRIKPWEHDQFETGEVNSPEALATPRGEPWEDSSPSDSPAPTEEPDDDPLTGAKIMPPAEDLANMTELPYHPDLNRNGISETLLVGQYRRWDTPDDAADDAYPVLGVGVWEDGELLWSSASPRIMGDQQAYLLTDLDNGDYLLYYCDCARFILFDLVGGKPHVASEQTISYTLSPAEEVEDGFDPTAIAAFMDAANALLSRSTILVDKNDFFTGKELKVDFSWLENYVTGFTWNENAPNLENLTRFKAYASQPEPAPVPASVETVRQARTELLDALLGKTDFTYYTYSAHTYQANLVDINTAPHTAFHLTEEWGRIYDFAVVDLDGDSVEEVVLHVTDVAGDMGGYLILHWMEPGDIRCYDSYWRTFWNLKTDGTFHYDYYMGVSGSAQVSFPAPGYRMNQHSIMEGRIDMTSYSDPPKGTFTVNGSSVSREEYEAAAEAQSEKPDAVWYEFTPENVKKAFG